MRIAIDLDGTISAHPKEFRTLMASLLADGHEVFVLTAAAGELPPTQRPGEVRKRLLRLGFPESTPIVCVESSQKPDYCRMHGVDILFDDTPFNMKHTLQLIPA